MSHSFMDHLVEQETQRKIVSDDYNCFNGHSRNVGTVTIFIRFYTARLCILPTEDKLTQ